MIETDFKKGLVEAQKSYFTSNITDDEIFELNMEILGGMVHTMLADYSLSTLVKVLSYYLINSVGNYETKEKTSEEISKFIEFANTVKVNSTELLVFDAALMGFQEQ